MVSKFVLAICISTIVGLAMVSVAESREVPLGCAWTECFTENNLPKTDCEFFINQNSPRVISRGLSLSCPEHPELGKHWMVYRRLCCPLEVDPTPEQKKEVDYEF